MIVQSADSLLPRLTRRGQEKGGGVIRTPPPFLRLQLRGRDALETHLAVVVGRPGLADANALAVAAANDVLVVGEDDVAIRAAVDEVTLAVADEDGVTAGAREDSVAAVCIDIDLRASEDEVRHPGPRS